MNSYQQCDDVIDTVFSALAQVLMMKQLYIDTFSVTRVMFELNFSLRTAAFISGQL